MINYIPYFLIGFSLAGLFIIIYRKIPVVANLSEEEMTILDRKKGIFRRVKDVDYKQHWLNFIISLEKFLRRIKIIFLKIENLLTKWISGLRGKSQIMTQKSREWITQRELKRQQIKEDTKKETKEEISITIKREGGEAEPVEESDDLPISELKKPIKEEQKWINLIVENPKNITAYKFLGLLYWKQHNYSDAKASLEMAVKLGSKDRKVKEVLEDLKKLEVK